MPVSIESKRSRLHFKPHQIWQVTAYSTFIAALFSISALGYSHDLKICWSSSVLSPALTFVLASVLVLPSVLTSVLASALASVITDPCSYNVHLIFTSYSSSVQLTGAWPILTTTCTIRLKPGPPPRPNGLTRLKLGYHPRHNSLYVIWAKASGLDPSS